MTKTPFSPLATPPTLDELKAIAEAALKTLPDELAGHVTGVVIRVADFPDLEIERDLGLGSPFDLLGLYQGVSLDRKSVSDPHPEVDMIFLYRRPILDYWCETGEDLAHVVRHVLIHEIGHHFGLSDADMERIERQG
ncbi:MAG: acetylglutamate kinase [Rhodospirillaceae bacterium]|jgi:predicted Zn-dependent protease with MMP-like domain|nr:acetylglutamate kinase [Rhodospirillaceae bacterium]|tara:strand:- start:46 stop:456 length:411 start_codon:yes stop_codon:yes gene_type:complete